MNKLWAWVATIALCIVIVHTPARMLWGLAILFVIALLIGAL